MKNYYVLKNMGSFVMGIVSVFLVFTNGFADSSDPFLGARLNIQPFLSELNRRLPEEGKNKTYTETINIIKDKGFQKLYLYLYPDKEEFLSLVIVIPGEESSLREMLEIDSPWKEYLIPQENGTYRIKDDTLTAKKENQPPNHEYTLKIIDNKLIFASDKLFDNWEKSGAGVEQTPVAQLLKETFDPMALGHLTVKFPEDMDIDIEGKLKNQQIIKSYPQARMFAAMLGSVVNEFIHPFKSLKSISIGFSFLENNERKIDYAQQLRENVDGKAMLKTLENKNWEAADLDGIVLNMAKILEDNRLKSTLGLDNNNLKISLIWNEKDDSFVGESLTDATIGYLFFKGMAGSIKPTEGKIQPKYRQAPELSNNVDCERLKKDISSLTQKSLFPGHFWKSGDEPYMGLECDSISVPNADLAEMEFEIISITSADGKSLMRSAEDKFGNSIDLNSSYSQIRLPVLKGTTDKQLKSAVIRFSLSMPVKLSTVIFTSNEAKGIIKTVDDIEIKLTQLERDVAGVNIKGAESGKLFAYDASGQALRQSTSVSGRGAFLTQFKGVIEKLQVVVPRQSWEYSFEVKIDLNQGHRLKLSDEPSDDVRVRYDHKTPETYPDYTPEELAGLKVQWEEGDDAGWKPSIIFIDLPNGMFHGNSKWEAHFFGQGKPLLLKDSSISTGNRLCYNIKNDVFKEISAVLGKLKMNVFSDLTRIEFIKENNIPVIEKELSSGKILSVRFDKNYVIYKAKDLEVVQVMAYDSSGKRLKQDNYYSWRNNEIFRRFWGMPTKFIIEAAQDKFTALIPFELKKDTVAQEAYNKYKDRVEIYREIVGKLNQVGKSHTYNFWQSGDTLSGLYFVFDRSNKKPRQAISKEIALSDPDGAKLFGYEVQPYKGYYFMHAKGTKDKDGKTDYKRSDQEEEFKWEKGTFSIRQFQEEVAIMAVPVSPEDPTFTKQGRGDVYMCYLNGQECHYRPERMYNSDWVEVFFIAPNDNRNKDKDD